MTKDDLKVGWWVEIREGDFYRVTDIRHIKRADGGWWLDLSDYSNDLMYQNKMSELDIVKVYKPKANLPFDINNVTLAWQRTEQTPEQKRIAELETELAGAKERHMINSDLYEKLKEENTDLKYKLFEFKDLNINKLSEDFIDLRSELLKTVKENDTLKQHLADKPREFKVGDRVQCVRYDDVNVKYGEFGLLIIVDDDYSPYGVRWDRNIRGHDLRKENKPNCEDGHGRWMHKGDIALVGDIK